LGGSSLHFISGKKPQIKKLQENRANFIEISPKPTPAIKEKIISKIELDLPMGITLRIYQ
jgi:hypothetical protein